MKEMTFLDFFSGIGGFRRGFELCGMRCAGHCEIDRHADRSYRAIHDVKEDEWYAADIRTVRPADLPRADLWACLLYTSRKTVSEVLDLSGADFSMSGELDEAMGEDGDLAI